MPTVTSVTLNGLEICSSADYALHKSTLVSLLAGAPREPMMIDMQARAPEFQRSQVRPRPIQITIMLLANTISLRETNLTSIITACADGTLVPLIYTKGATSKTYMVHCSGPVPSDTLHRVTIEAVAPDPVAT